MDFMVVRRQRATQVTSRLTGRAWPLNAVRNSVAGVLRSTASIASEAYTGVLNWKNNSEVSNWLTDHLSNQHATLFSKAMDAEYLRTHIGGGWHRLYDGGHSLVGSWKAVSSSLPDLGTLHQLRIWANEYWKDLITTRGMPIFILDHADQVSEYFKHLDCVNVAQLIGGDICGVSIYCNWNDPAKLVASATATECSGIVYANVVAPLVSLIALGRAYFLIGKSEQDDLQDLIAPALKGLSRSGATVLLITAIPGGFLLHLSSGIVISLAHNYIWDKGSENKEAILTGMKSCLANLQGSSALRQLPFVPHWVGHRAFAGFARHDVTLPLLCVTPATAAVAADEVGRARTCSPSFTMRRRNTRLLSGPFSSRCPVPAHVT
jgi:hypothetical protein